MSGTINISPISASEFTQLFQLKRPCNADNITLHTVHAPVNRLCKFAKKRLRNTSDFGALSVRPFRPFNEIEFSIYRCFKTF